MPKAHRPAARSRPKAGRSVFLPPATAQSLTALMAEALRRGATGHAGRRVVDEIPHEGAAMRCGDPDDRALDNEYVGDELPGGAAPTPDQNQVDEIGRAYGLQDEDSGALRTSAEILQRRDRRRAELRSPSPRRSR